MEKPIIRTHFVLGHVGPPFGLKGFVKVKPYSGETSHFFKLTKVILKQEEKEHFRDVAEVIAQGSGLLIRFEGINSSEAAGTLKGAEIISERKFAAPLKNGEYYIEDLKGLEVVNYEGKVLGIIINIIEGGGGHLAEVKLLSGFERLVPFRKEFFGEISIDNGKIELLEQWILE